jgi:hypothetical protein
MELDLSYGQWCTIEGERYMITSWSAETVTVYYFHSLYVFPRSAVSEVSDFKQTDAERKAAGYAF